MKKITILFYLIVFSFINLACLWDRDTITFESENFPSTLEMITGNFIRHSPEFYQWRIQDREAKLKTNPNQWNYYDDLAVAYDKTGNHTKAIELMQQKEKLHPNQYETYANLGTFYIHNKQYQEGLKYIDKAIAINVNAHFGREIYQKHLVTYLLSKMKNGNITLPLNPYAQNHYHQTGFHYYLKKKQKDQYKNSLAIFGVMGMIKFGKHNSPILMEVLGDLLAGDSKSIPNAPYFAYMAYQQAGKFAQNATAKQLYLNKNPIKNQWPTLKYHLVKRVPRKQIQQYVDKELAYEVQKGQLLAQQIKRDETHWITTKVNPETQFDQKYLKKDRIQQYMDWQEKQLKKSENRLKKKLDMKITKDSTPDSTAKSVKKKTDITQRYGS